MFDFGIKLGMVEKVFYRLIPKHLRRQLLNYIRREDVRSSFYPHYKQKRSMRKCLKGSRVLIVGSGASASELREIPKGFKILTCNYGLKILSECNHHNVDLYLGFEYCLTLNQYILPEIKKHKFDLFISDLENTKKLGVDATFLFDFPRNFFYLKQLLPSAQMDLIKKISSSSGHKQLLSLSSGMILLNYALYFGASEIFLIGMDFSHDYDERFNLELESLGRSLNRPIGNSHVAVDTEVMKAIAEKYQHIYSASQASPVVKFVPYKKIY